MTHDEPAAIAIALRALEPADELRPSQPAPWKLAMLHPDLDVDDLRALARGERNVL